MSRNKRRNAAAPIVVPPSVIERLSDPMDYDTWRADVAEVSQLLEECGDPDPSGSLKDAGFLASDGMRRLLGYWRDESGRWVR